MMDRSQQYRAIDSRDDRKLASEKDRSEEGQRGAREGLKGIIGEMC